MQDYLYRSVEGPIHCRRRGIRCPDKLPLQQPHPLSVVDIIIDSYHSTKRAPSVAKPQSRFLTLIPPPAGPPPRRTPPPLVDDSPLRRVNAVDVIFHLIIFITSAKWHRRFVSWWIRRSFHFENEKASRVDLVRWFNSRWVRGRRDEEYWRFISRKILLITWVCLHNNL